MGGDGSAGSEHLLRDDIYFFPLFGKFDVKAHDQSGKPLGAVSEFRGQPALVQCGQS